MTINDHWSFNRADNDWKDTDELLRNLIDIVSKGGNFLLNVGPTGEGVIPQPSAERLTEIGQWLKVNGEAVYGCGPTPFGGEFESRVREGDGKSKTKKSWNWRATTKPNKIYIHLFNWPTESLVLPAIGQEVSAAFLLADPKTTSLEVSQTDTSVSISLPADETDKLGSVVCIELKS